MTTAFQRARSEAQREARRQVILQTAAAMLGEMSVSELSLNELSRRVGLAKSNVLRYFESREAVLLELLDSASHEWLADLRARLDGVERSSAAPARTEAVALAITDSLVAHPLLCELISVSAAVLERNISADVARRFKVSSTEATATFAGMVGAVMPELSAPASGNFAAAATVAVAGMWPLTHPAEAMLCVYEDPQFAAMRVSFATAMRELLATLLAGSLVRSPVTSIHPQASM